MPTPLESATAEKRLELVKTTADPTGQAVDFAVGLGQTPTAWVAGTWVAGTAATFIEPMTGQTRWRAVAQSPLVGQGQALDLASRGSWKLWVRWRIGSESIVRLCEVLQVV